MFVSASSRSTSLTCLPLSGYCEGAHASPIQQNNTCAGKSFFLKINNANSLSLLKTPPHLIRQIVLSISQGDWISVFEKAPGIRTRGDIAHLLNAIVDNKTKITPELAHFVRCLFARMPYDMWLDHHLKARKFSPIRAIGRASVDERLKALSHHPRKALEALPTLSAERSHQLLEWIYENGRLAELELVIEERFVPAESVTRFRKTHKEWSGLEERFRAYYRSPSTVPAEEKLEIVGCYIGIPGYVLAAKNDDVARLSMYRESARAAQATWQKAKRNPDFLDYLFKVSQLADFLNDDGKTTYKRNSTLCSFAELVEANTGLCESFSFLFSSLAPIISLQVYAGFYPGHAFVYTSEGNLVVETTARYNLRPAKNYRFEALQDTHAKVPIPAYWHIRWRLVSNVFKHCFPNKGDWDSRILVIATRLFPNDPIFHGQFLQSQLAYAHLTEGNYRSALAIYRRMRKSSPKSIPKKLLREVQETYRKKGIVKAEQAIQKFLDSLTP